MKIKKDITHDAETINNYSHTEEAQILLGAFICHSLVPKLVSIHYRRKGNGDMYLQSADYLEEHKNTVKFKS